MSEQKEVAVIEENELQSFRDIGLGRGVDGTQEHPWNSKGSFQVRPVLFEDLLGTEQGGILQDYEKEVASIQDTHTELSASLSIPSTSIDLGLDAETSRSITSTRWIKGKKLTTRTVSFALRFKDGLEPSEPILTAEGNESATVSPNEVPFEQRLSSWIIDDIRASDPTVDLAVADESKSVETLKSYIQEKEDGDSILLNHCKSFVKEFRVTHFVTSIDLGAAEYQDYTETEYKEKASSGVNVGVSKVFSAKFSHDKTSTETNKTTDHKKIGVIESDGTVKRGSYGEAAVGVKLLPITNLLQEYNLLHRAMRAALFVYFALESDTMTGPFIVTCSDKLFWRAKEDNCKCTLEATDDIAQATSFYIFPQDDKDNTDEFLITRTFSKYEDKSMDDVTVAEVDDYYKVQGYSHFSLSPVPQYLDTTAGMFGYNDGPLHFKYNLNADFRLVIISRTSQSHLPCGLTGFTSGKDLFYIKNAERKWSRDGYLCTKQVGDGESKRFVSALVPSTAHHNDHTVFMLFRLLPTSLRHSPEIFWNIISGSEIKDTNEAQ